MKSKYSNLNLVLRREPISRCRLNFKEIEGVIFSKLGHSCCLVGWLQSCHRHLCKVWVNLQLSPFNADFRILSLVLKFVKRFEGSRNFDTYDSCVQNVAKKANLINFTLYDKITYVFNHFVVLQKLVNFTQNKGFLLNKF